MSSRRRALANAVAGQVRATEEQGQDLPRGPQGDRGGLSPAEGQNAPLSAVRFDVVVGPGRQAIVILPGGMTALEALRLVGQIPALAAQASQVPADPEQARHAAARSRLILPGS